MACLSLVEVVLSKELGGEFKSHVIGSGSMCGQALPILRDQY